MVAFPIMAELSPTTKSLFLVALLKMVSMEVIPMKAELSPATKSLFLVMPIQRESMEATLTQVLSPATKSLFPVARLMVLFMAVFLRRLYPVTRSRFQEGTLAPLITAVLMFMAVIPWGVMPSAMKSLWTMGKLMDRFLVDTPQ